MLLEIYLSQCISNSIIYCFWKLFIRSRLNRLFSMCGEHQFCFTLLFVSFHPPLVIASSKCMCLQLPYVHVKRLPRLTFHYGDVIMGAIASQITSFTVVYSTVYSDADQRKHQSSASLAFVWGIHRASMNSPHKWPVTRKMFPLMTSSCNLKIVCSIKFAAAFHQFLLTFVGVGVVWISSSDWEWSKYILKP